MGMHRKRWFILLWVLLLGPILLYGAIISPPGMALVRRIIQSQINRRIAGTLSIGRIRSNLLSWITVERIQLKTEGATTAIDTASARMVEVQYSPFGLVRGDLSDVKIAVEAPFLRLRGKGASRTDSIPSPAEPVRPSSVQIPIPGRVQISGGALQYMDEAQHLSIALRDIKLDEICPSGSRWATGNLHIGGATIRAGAYREPSIALQATFQIAPDSLRLSDLQIQATHTSLKGKGEISFLPQPTLHLSAESKTNLTAALKTFAPLPSDSIHSQPSDIQHPTSNICKGGTLLVRVTADGPVEAPRLVVGVRLQALQTDWGDVDSLSGRLRMEGEHVDIADLEASVAGGHVVGEGTLDREGDRWTYALAARLDDVDLGQMAGFLQMEEAMGGRLSGTLSLRGEMGGFPTIASSLTGKLQLISEELVIAGREIGPAELYAHYEAGAVGLSAEALGMKMEGTGQTHFKDSQGLKRGPRRVVENDEGLDSLNVWKSWSGHVSVKMEASDLGSLNRLTGVELTGTGSIQATVQGVLSHPRIHLRLQGDEVVVANVALKHVSGDVEYAPDGPLRVQLNAHDGHIRVAGTMDVRRKRVGPMVLSVDRLNVPAAFPLLGKAQVEGWIGAKGTLTGSFDHPRFDGSFHVHGVRWRGESFVGIEGQANLHGRSLQWALASTTPASQFLRRGAEEPVLRDSTSALCAHGRLHLMEPFPFETTVIARNLDLTPLLNALHVGEKGHTKGLLSGSIVTQGTTQDLRAVEATLTLDTLSVMVNDRELHSLHGGNMHLAKGRISTDDLDLTGEAGTVHIGGYMGLSGEQQFRVQVQDGHLSALFPRSVGDEVLDGVLNGHLSITGSASSPQIYGELEAADFTLQGIREDVVTLQMDYTEGSLLLSGWWDQPRGGQIQTDLAIPVDLSFTSVAHERLSRPFLLSATAKVFDLKGLRAIFPEAVSDFGGMVSADLTFEGDPIDPLRAEGDLIVEAVTLFANGGVWTNVVPIRIALGGGTAEVQSFESVFAREWGPQPGEGTLRCVGRFSLTSDSDLHMVARSADMGLIAGIFGLGDEVGGRLDAEIAWTGPPEDPRLCMEARMDGARFDPLRFGPVEGAVFYENGRLNIHQATFSVGEGRISVRGGIPLDLRLHREGSGGPVGDMEMTVTSQDLNLAFLKSLSPDIRVLNGEVAVDLRLTGERTAPKLHGNVNLTSGRLQLKGMKSEVTVEKIALLSKGDTLRVSTIGGKAGKGTWGFHGMLDVGCWISAFLSPSTLPSVLHYPKWEVTLWTGDARVYMPKIVDLTVRGDLSWSGDPTASDLSGEMWIRKGTVTKSLDISALLPFAERIRRPPTEPGPLRRGLSLDVRLQTESTLKVENDLASLPLEVHLDIGGTALRPALTGNIRAEKGKIYYLDRTFDLDRFSLLLTDPYRMDPEVDLAAHCEVIDDQGQAYSIELDVSGTAFQPILELSGSSALSEAPLNQPSIVSLLTLGTTTEQLFGDPTVRADQLLLSRTKELVRRRLLGLTSREIEHFLNIDQVYIEADLFDPSTLVDARIRMDKRIAKRLRVSYSTVIGHSGEEWIEVDYRLTDHLSVQTQADRKGNSGIDLTFKVRFP